MKNLILNILKEESVYRTILEESFEDVADKIINAMKEKGYEIEDEHISWWNNLGGNGLTRLINQGELVTKYYGQLRKVSSMKNEEILEIYKHECLVN